MPAARGATCEHRGMNASALADALRCPECAAPLQASDLALSCGEHRFPIVGGIPRLLPSDLMRVLQGAEAGHLRARTYRSFAFEWTSFKQQLDSYERNFRWYLEPLGATGLAGCRVLDAGCGMGRHTYHFLKAGAHVVAVDASPAVEVAAANAPSGQSLFVQADLLRLPLAPASFDLVCCLGVLHHIDDTLGGLRALVAAVRPGGRVLVFLYHDAGRSCLRRALLAAVSTFRHVTTRLPLGVLHALTLALAVVLWVTWVGPLKLLARTPWGRRLRGLPLGQYVEYPFRVLWNDQFDRFSAPLEKRYSRAAVEQLMASAGLADVTVLPGYGWRAAGTRPLS
jgi:SAM-dependent methyltransferase